MQVQASIIAAVLPISIYLVFLWQADRFERESFSDILKHFLWGALGAVFLSLAGGKFYSNLLELFLPRGNRLTLLESIYFAPVFEEASKAIFLFYTISSKKIDNVTDGLVYGGSIGLGFGMIENFFYFLLFDFAGDSWITLVVMRSVFSAVMHAVSTAAMGAFIAKALYSGKRPKILFYISGLFSAILIHFIWNLSVSFEFSFYLGIIFMSILIALFIIYFFRQKSIEKKIIITELQEECDTGLLPYHYLPIISSGNKDKKGWIDERIRNEYSNAAVKLALRKNQMKTSGRNLLFFEKEIEYYRNKIQELSGKYEG